LPELTDFDGNLHRLPDVYCIDPDIEVTMLIYEKKRRYKEVQPGGKIYELYHKIF